MTAPGPEAPQEVARDEEELPLAAYKLEADPPVVSHFGHGIITFHLPYVFRTPPGWNLLVRGPANRPKDGIAPLEGLVETDWAPSTFTMNWQLTRPGPEVDFCADEPVGMIVPQRRAELERFRPTVAGLDQMPDMRQYHRWKRSRMNFIVDLDRPGSPGTSVTCGCGTGKCCRKIRGGADDLWGRPRVTEGSNTPMRWPNPCFSPDNKYKWA